MNGSVGLLIFASIFALVSLGSIMYGSSIIARPGANKSTLLISGGIVGLLIIAPWFFSMADGDALKATQDQFPPMASLIEAGVTFFTVIKLCQPWVLLIGGLGLLLDGVMEVLPGQSSMIAADTGQHWKEGLIAMGIGICLLITSWVSFSYNYPASISEELIRVHQQLKEKPGVSVSLHPFSIGIGNWDDFAARSSAETRQIVEDAKTTADPTAAKTLIGVQFYSTDDKSMNGIILFFEDGTSARVDKKLSGPEQTKLFEDLRIVYTLPRFSPTKPVK